MRATDAFVAAALAASPAAWASPSPPPSDDMSIPHTYIVELEPDADAAAALPLSASDHFSRKRADFGYTARREYNNRDLFYGLSLTVTDGSDASRIERLPGVKRVWQSSYVPRPEPVNPRPPPESGHSPSRIMGGEDGAEKPKIPYIEGDSDVNRPLKMGGVDKVHEQGVKGKGVKIAVIDSGVDYTHPSLGGGFGPGHKISFGYDLVGDDYDGWKDPVPDDDPMVSCATGYHGTHVSGIIGMQDEPGTGFGLMGVAPEAELGMYRIFGCTGGSSDELIMDAMMRAAEDGADVISMSLGKTVRWEAASIFNELAEKLDNKGIAVIAAAGNAGPVGPFGISDPALAASVLSVGSVGNEIMPTTYHAHDEEGRKIEYFQILPFDGENAIFVLGSGVEDNDPALNPANGCDDRAWDVAFETIKDQANTIIMLEQDDTCSSFTIDEALERFNTTRLFYYPSTPEHQLWVEYAVADHLAAVVDYETGQKIKAEAGKRWPEVDYTIKFDGKEVHGAKNPYGGVVDDFSSYGPSVEGTMNPDVTGPGGNILSTYPLTGGGYATLSGTSMATPFLAGCYALIKSQRPDLGIAEIYDLLRSTAVPVKAGGSDLTATTAQQGAGLVNVFAALNTKTVIKPTALNLRDGKPPPQKISIENKSKSPKTYTVSHRPASYVNLIGQFKTQSDPWTFKFIRNDAPNYGDAEFSETTFELQPGASVEMEVKITPPEENITPIRQPLYSGFVEITESSGENEESHSVPYIGIPYDRYEAGPLGTNTSAYYDQGQELPRMRPWNAEEGKPNIDYYSFNTSVGSGPATMECLIAPPKYVRFDLVPANTTFKPTLYGFDPSVEIDYEHPANLTVLPGFLGVPSYGLWLQFGAGDEIPGGSQTQPNIVWSTMASWIGKLQIDDEGIQVDATPGDYRLLLRVLRYGGDLAKPEDYQSWLGPVIRIIENPRSVN